MSSTDATYASNVVRVDIELSKTITDENNNEKTKTINYSWEDKDPEHVLSLTHTLNGGGMANTLTLTLYQYINPYTYDEDSPYHEAVEEDVFGNKTNDPSYLVLLLSQGFSDIKIRYGYCQSSDAYHFGQTYNSSIVGGGYSKRSDWYKMKISDISMSFDTSSVTYTVEAVSTIAGDSTGENSINWICSEDKSLDGTSSENSDEEKEVYTGYLTQLKEHYNGTINEATGENMVPAIVSYILNGNDTGKYEIIYTGDSGISEEGEPIGNTIIPQIISDDQDVLAQCYTQTRQTNAAYLQTLLNQASYRVDNCDPVQRDDKEYTNVYKIYTGWFVDYDDEEGPPQKAYIKYSSIDYYTTNDDGEPYLIKSEAAAYGGALLGNLFYNCLGVKTNYNSIMPEYTFMDYQSGTSGARADFSYLQQNLLDSGIINSSNQFKAMSLIKQQSDKIMSEIISLNMTFPIMSSLVMAYYDSEKYYSTDNNGEDTGSYGLNADESTIKSRMLSFVQTLEGYKKIANQLILEASLTIPGYSGKIQMLSQFNLWIMIGNKIDPISGIYQVLSQTDTIQNGTFTTTLEIVKVKAFNGEEVYKARNAPTAAPSADNGTGSGGQTISGASSYISSTDGVLTLGTWNIGRTKYAKISEKQKYIKDKLNICDILCLQECLSVNIEDLTTDLLKYFKKFCLSPNHTAMLSKTGLTELKGKLFKNQAGEKRAYSYTSCSFGNTSITVGNTHTTFSDENVVVQNLIEAFEALESTKCSYLFLLGDFNCHKKTFEEAIRKHKESGNSSYTWKFLITDDKNDYSDVGKHNKYRLCIDQILYASRSGYQFKDVKDVSPGPLPSNLSDHRATVAQFKLY